MKRLFKSHKKKPIPVEPEKTGRALEEEFYHRWVVSYLLEKQTKTYEELYDRINEEFEEEAERRCKNINDVYWWSIVRQDCRTAQRLKREALDKAFGKEKE